MLYADKLALHSSLAKEMLGVRERELEYYTSNMQNISTNSALLVGFAMTILSNYEVSDKNWSDVTDFSLGDWNHQKNYLELVYILSTTAAIVCQLWTMINGIMATILGPGLALRGPEGSMDKAVKGMAIENQKTIHIFFLGIIFFHISIAFNALLTYHFIVASITVVALLMSFVWLIRHLCYGLLPKFYIPLNQVVDGRFQTDREEAGVERNRARYNRRQAGQFTDPQSVGKLLAGSYQKKKLDAPPPLPRRRFSVRRRAQDAFVPAPSRPDGPAHRESFTDIPTDVAHGLMLKMQGDPLRKGNDGRIQGQAPVPRSRSAPRSSTVARNTPNTAFFGAIFANQPPPLEIPAGHASYGAPPSRQFVRQSSDSDRGPAAVTRRGSSSSESRNNIAAADMPEQPLRPEIDPFAFRSVWFPPRREEARQNMRRDRDASREREAARRYE